MKKHRYSVIIQWSEEDQVYVVTLPEWGGCHTHGETYEEAAKNAQEVLDLLTEEDSSTRLAPAPHSFIYPGPSGFTYDLSQSMTASHSAPTGNQIKSLMSELKSATEQGDKKVIRARLRRAGHFGGLRTPPQKTSKAEVHKFRRSST